MVETIDISQEDVRVISKSTWLDLRVGILVAEIQER